MRRWSNQDLSNGLWLGFRPSVLVCGYLVILTPVKVAWSFLHLSRWLGDLVEIEMYNCPLKDQCDCPVQFSILLSVVNVVLEISSGVHTKARCYFTDKSKNLNYKQSIAVAKIVKANPAVTSSDV